MSSSPSPETCHGTLKESSNQVKSRSVVVYCFEDEVRPYNITTERLNANLDCPLSDACSELESRFPGHVVRLFVIKEPKHARLARHLQTFLNGPPVRDWEDLVDLEDIEGVMARDLLITNSVYFAAVLERRGSLLVQPEEVEEPDHVLLDLPSRAFENFQQTVKLYRQRPSPSSAATSTGYEKEQGTEHTGLYDGRVKVNGPPRSAPPIELYHPAFGQFRHGLQSTAPIPKDLLQLVAEFLRKLSVLRHFEDHRGRDIRSILNDLLSTSLVRLVNWDRSVANAVSKCNTPANQTACPVIVEWKSEPGAGGSDPSVQVSFSHCKIYVSPEREKVLQASSCPSFLISIAGPWLLVSGAVFAGKPIIQRLTSYEWLGRARVNDPRQVSEIARIFLAIREPLAALQSYYANLVIPSVPRPNCMHPRFFPHITSYPVGAGAKDDVQFAYVCPLQDSVACVAFEAVLLDTNERVVVKFVAKYGESTHRYMADRHMAPALRYFGLLDPHSDHTYAGLSMAVMDKLAGATLHDRYADSPIPDDVEREVEAAAQELKNGGFVHGDLRPPNIVILDSPVHGSRVRLIDFDWAREVGKVQCPCDLTSAVMRPTGASDYDMVTVKHMYLLVKAMLRKP